MSERRPIARLRPAVVRVNACDLCTVPLHPHEGALCDPCAWAIADQRNTEWDE